MSAKSSECSEEDAVSNKGTNAATGQLWIGPVPLRLEDPECSQAPKLEIDGEPVPVMGALALKAFVDMVGTADRILDIGPGAHQIASRVMRENGLSPETCDVAGDVTFQGSFEETKFPHEFDAIWCSHVLEHTLNQHDFLRKLRRDIREGGLLAITVPPLKHSIVSGHVNLFNPGLLLYRLVIAGFDCSSAKVRQYGYNISIVMRVKKIELPKAAVQGLWSLDLLKDYFPIPVKPDFDGQIKSANWD